jgi:hypothetical protein
MFREPSAVNEVIRSDRGLRKGIPEIMTRRFAPISYPYLSASAVLVLTGLIRAQSPGVRPKFDVASIKPNTSVVRSLKFPFPYSQERSMSTSNFRRKVRRSTGAGRAISTRPQTPILPDRLSSPPCRSDWDSGWKRKKARLRGW